MKPETKEQMKPETKLKVAAEEIKEVLRKHDIAATVALHTPGHGKYFFHFNTSYSCAYIYEDGHVHFYSKLKGSPSEDELLKRQESTSNMLRILADTTAMNFENVDKMSKYLDKKLNASHDFIDHNRR